METEARDQGYNELKEAIHKLHSSHEHYDLEISCGGRIFKCHGFLFWPRSKYFAVAIKGGFKKSFVTQRLELPEDNPNLISKLVQFAYKSDYDDSKYLGLSALESHAYISALHTNVDVYAMGEKYDMQALKELAMAKFKLRGNEGPIATHICPLITLIYASTPQKDRGMRDIVLAYALQNSKWLAMLPDFKSMIAENLDFVADFFGRTFLLKTPPLYTGACKRCTATDKWKADHVTCGCGWGERI